MIATAWATFLGNRRLQGLPAIVETEGQQGKGADEHEIRKLRELHAAGSRRRRGWRKAGYAA